MLRVGKRAAWHSIGSRIVCCAVFILNTYITFHDLALIHSAQDQISNTLKTPLIIPLAYSNQDIVASDHQSLKDDLPLGLVAL